MRNEQKPESETHSSKEVVWFFFKIFVFHFYFLCCEV